MRKMYGCHVRRDGQTSSEIHREAGSAPRLETIKNEYITTSSNLIQIRTKVSTIAREHGSAKHNFEEDLRVEVEGRRVEGRTEDLWRRVDIGLVGDTVRGKKVDEFLGRETGIGHAVEDLVNGVFGLGDEAERRGRRVVGTTRHELQAGAAHAVAHADGTSELDAVESVKLRCSQT